MKTDLKPFMMQLQGGQYLKVPGRIVAFRDQYPNGSILTELVNLDLERGFAMFKATVSHDGTVLATAFGSETQRSFPAGWLEKAETVAVGRALAQAGFGTAYAMSDFHEGAEHKLSDSPASSRSVPQAAAVAQDTEQSKKVKQMFAIAKEAGITPASLRAMLAEKGFPTASQELAVEHLDEMIKLLQADF
jgi:hypothetical protein